MADKPKTTLYHSQACGMSPIQCRVVTEPAQSKYPNRETGIKPDWVELLIDGVKRQYICETAACSQALRGLSGKNVMLEFTGSRHDAMVRVLGAGQSQQPQPDPENDGRQEEPPPDFHEQPNRQRTPAPRQESAAQSPEQAADNLRRARHFLQQVANLRGLCLDAATWLIQRHNKKHPELPMGSADVRELSTSIFITADQGNQVERMPMTPLPDDAKGGKQ